MKQPVSELRLDLVSNDWVIIATGRGRRPETFSPKKRAQKPASAKNCPFCQPQILEKAILKYGESKNDWSVMVMPNDYPVFAQGEDLNERASGPNKIMDGLGFHEVIITKDHRKQMAQFSQKEIKEVIDVYQTRYLDLMNNKKCVYCAMIEWDSKEGKRIIYENDKFIVLSPFAPKVSFETRVYPKEHLPYFEKMSEKEKELFAEAFGIALTKLYQGLGDPAYNFYIHTAPCDRGNYKHYHWHLIILPKTAVWAGFELGTGIEVSTIEPERAADFLRKQ